MKRREIVSTGMKLAVYFLTKVKENMHYGEKHLHLGEKTCIRAKNYVHSSEKYMHSAEKSVHLGEYYKFCFSKRALRGDFYIRKNR